MRYKLRERRLELGFSQTRISEIANIERTKYSRIENGSLKKINLKDAYAIAQALETAISNIFMINDLYIMHNNQVDSFKFANEISEKGINKQIEIDELTNIPNRPTIIKKLKNEWNIAIKNKHSMAVIIADIDNFKEYNDAFGSLVGDKCLFEIAAILNNLIKRPGDFVGRYEEDEFLIMLSNINVHGAMAIAEEIQGNISKNESAGGVSLSLGVVVAVANKNISIEQIITLAYRALLDAKRQEKIKLLYVSYETYLNIMEY